ncbi:MAG: hypothetical protein JNK05_06545 [Myxococcales bacterium]|nr:hypothetical protein [Myxococcales bacterium]
MIERRLLSIVTAASVLAIASCAPRARRPPVATANDSADRARSAGAAPLDRHAFDRGFDGGFDARSPLRWRRYAIGDVYFDAPDTITRYPTDAIDSTMFSMRVEGISIETDSTESSRVEGARRSTIALGSWTAELELVEREQERSATVRLPPAAQEPADGGQRRYIASSSGGVRTMRIAWTRAEQAEIAMTILRSLRRASAPPGALAVPEGDAFVGVAALLRFRSSVEDGSPDRPLATLAAERLGAAIAREPNHPDVLWWMWKRVEALVALERHRDVIDVASQARASIASDAQRHRFNTTDDLLLAEVAALSASGEHATALERIRELLRSMSPFDQRARMDVRGTHAELLARAGRDEEAQAEFRQVRFSAIAPASLAERLRRASSEVDARLHARRRSGTHLRGDGGR